VLLVSFCGRRVDRLVGFWHTCYPTFLSIASVARLTRSSNPIDGAFSVNLTNKLAGRMITTGYIYSYHFRKPPNKP
jgi:hypothetical protein